ncbi:hypothetical protein [Arthrobacter sp. M4]|uniref:hypothetical protein n=1 Tax=Arthrobacter sp. M4 TaxID=218160 RepID=UPI001CDCCB6E|nr:hypothetical protein [Arthrobacter sp. M4]MCA4134055.1 hypothetical protein [Arthrobacter sp. M4]
MTAQRMIPGAASHLAFLQREDLRTELGERPEIAAEELSPSQWPELSRGEEVWIHEDGWGFDTGRVDEVSKYQEMIWIDLAGRGRRLICGGDPVQIWTRG